MWKRTTITLVLLAAAVPASASAATAPTITDPSRASVRSGHPEFTWRAGPSGEQVTGISIGALDAVDERGALASTAGGARLEPIPAGATSARAARALHAGRHFWTADWASADGSETGATPVRSFVVPAFMRTLRGRYVQQTESNRFSASGTVSGNAWKVRVTCSVFGRNRLVSRQRVTRPMALGRRTSFRCDRLRIPESFDGERVRLHVSARGANRHAAAVTVFRAD